ncbi:pro protein, partial [Simian T-cell lymphotropic virus 6]
RPSGQRPKKLHRGGGLASPQTVLPFIPLSQQKQPVLHVRVSFPGTPPVSIQALLDTGADVTVLPARLCPPDLKLQDTTVLGASGPSTDKFKVLPCFTYVHLPFRGRPVTLPSCLIDINNQWAILGRDVLQQCQSSLYLADQPSRVLPIQTPSVIGLEHLPPPPEVPQFPLNQSASRP